MVTVYEFDPITRKFSGEVEYEWEGPQDLQKMSPAEAWELLQPGTKIKGSLWPPPHPDSLFIDGWYPSAPSSQHLAHLLLLGSIESGAVVDRADEVVDALIEINKPNLVLGEYDAQEVESWPIQLDEALNGGGPLLQAIADVENRTLQEIVNSVLEKHEERSRKLTTHVIRSNYWRRQGPLVREIVDPEARIQAAIDLRQEIINLG